MQLHQFFDQRQAQPEPALMPVGGALALGEEVKDVGHEFGVDAAAVVAHRQAQLVFVLRDLELQVTAGRRVLGGVFQQVTGDLDQSGRVAADQQVAGCQADSKVVLVGLDQRPYLLKRFIDDKRKVNGLHVEIDLAPRDSGDVEQVVNDACHVPGLLADDAGGVLDERVVVGLVAE